ncbi:MAG: amidohydrolase family protein [Rhodoferax sp.]|nr:amidohydrolase family protein [Rhodoferax sp.]
MQWLSRPSRAPNAAGSDFSLEVQKQLAAQGKTFASYGLDGGNSLNPLMHQIHDGRVPAEKAIAFRALAERSAQAGVKGFGEIALHHLSLNDLHAYETIPADDELDRVLIDVAAKYDLVMDVHFDPVLARMAKPVALTSPKNPSEFEANFEPFERLLAYNRQVKIIWAHAGGNDMLGSFTPQLAATMLAKHPNLFMSLRPRGMQPGVMLQGPGKLNPEWVAVVEKFADRFVMGSDSFLVADNAQGGPAARIFAERSAAQRQGIMTVLSVLPLMWRVKVGVDNAVRLYRLDQ